ncbi:MAG TPA: site-specific integrase [Chthoniobacterales bacterium]|jgi:integrase|nr:site-specific integrase [Chthoniobacterales bacterium]
MPSLTKDSRARSPYWICCYTSATGQRLKKSTKIVIKPFKGEKRKDGSPKTAADKRAEAWEACLGIERAEGHAKNGTLTEQAAKKIIGEILERTTGEALHNHKVRDWLAHWLDMKEQVRASKTATRYRQVIRDFITSLGNRANLALAHITPKDVLAYRNSIIAASKTARTANLSVKVVSAAFNAAVRQHFIESNPATALESLPVKAEEKATFTPAQVSKLICAADGDWPGVILLAYYTGARLGDVANMQWSAIDWRKKLIRFTPSKTKKPVTVPLHSQLERELLKKPGIGKTPMFPSLAGKDTGGRLGLSGRFAAIMEKAGIEGKITQPAKGGRALSNLSFHSLRHSFNSAMANAGVSQEIRQQLTGHASAEMNITRRLRGRFFCPIPVFRQRVHDTRLYPPAQLKASKNPVVS